MSVVEGNNLYFCHETRLIPGTDIPTRTILQGTTGEARKLLPRDQFVVYIAKIRFVPDRDGNQQCLIQVKPLNDKNLESFSQEISDKGYLAKIEILSLGLIFSFDKNNHVQEQIFSKHASLHIVVDPGEKSKKQVLLNKKIGRISLLSKNGLESLHGIFQSHLNRLKPSVQHSQQFQEVEHQRSSMQPKVQHNYMPSRGQPPRKPQSPQRMGQHNQQQQQIQQSRGMLMNGHQQQRVQQPSMQPRKPQPVGMGQHNVGPQHEQQRAQQPPMQPQGQKAEQTKNRLFALLKKQFSS